MNIGHLSSAARLAIGFDGMRRLGFHVSSRRLSVNGVTVNGPFRVTLSDSHGLLGERPAVSGVGLFAAIESLLAEAGEPLPTVDQWADISSILA